MTAQMKTKTKDRKHEMTLKQQELKKQILKTGDYIEDNTSQNIMSIYEDRRVGTREE